MTAFQGLRADPQAVRALRHGLWFAGLLYAGVYIVGFGDVAGFDSHAYWLAWSDHLYGGHPEQRDAYLYSPAFAQAIWPLTQLPWPIFFALWSSICAALFVWLLRPLGWRWGIPCFLLCVPEIVFGNVWAIFALVLVLGFRRPWLWAFPLLTKVTPAVGLAWFALRREWRNLAFALTAVMVAVVVSVAISPHLWLDWLSFLYHGDGYATTGRHSPPIVRLPIAAALTFYAARRDRPEMLAAAMLLASPVFGLNSLAVLAAIPRLRQRRMRPASSGGQPRAATSSTALWRSTSRIASSSATSEG